MRSLTFPGLSVALLSVAHAQPTFEKLYQSATSYTFDLIELPGNNILTCMAATHLLNPDGVIQHSSSYHGGGTYFTQTLKSAEENVFYFTTSTVAAPCSTGNGSLVHPVLGKMDSLGSVLTMRRYELNSGTCYNTPGGLEVTSNYGALTWGREHNFFGLRVDQDLEPVWCKRIHGSGGFKFIKELPGGDLLAGINMDTAGVVVARMDADGNFLWSKSYIRPKGVVYDALIESDDSFIIVGYTDSTNLDVFTQLPASFQPKLFMLKLNGAGEVQWCRGYFSTPDLWHTGTPPRIERTVDGNYAVLATLGYPQNNYFFRPFLMKTDLNGDTLWTRSVGRTDYTYLAQDLLPYSDGGLMFSGIIYGDMPGGASSLKYIFKTDSMGHFPCWERVHAVETLDLFPVDSSFALTAEDGLATATPVLVNDSISDPAIFITYNGCTFTTGMPLMRNRSPAKPRVYPNPNTGRFTVEFEDPLMAESYYSVYDAIGKLLFQRAAAHGQRTEEIDLSRYGKGTYVIKFTDPVGVCYERVVLE